jgi:hypothetical protein
MIVFRRILAGLVFLVALAVLLLSVAVGVGVWMVKGPVTSRANWVFGRIDAALDVAEQGLDHAQSSLANATDRLETVKQEQRKIAQEPRRNSTIGRFLARTIQQKLAPELSDAHETLHHVAEAAVVVNSVLEDFGNFPLLSVTGLNIDGLTDMNNRLGNVGPAAWELSRLLGQPEPEAGPESDPATAGRELSRVEQTLETVRGFVDDYHGQVRQASQRTAELKTKIFTWITPAAILISLACFWIAVSQVSLMCHARSWWKG